MELFVNELGSPQKIIYDYDKLTWVERYTDPGEFVLEGPLSGDLADWCKTDRVITHSGTNEWMWIESIEINEKEGEEPRIRVSGRTGEVVIESRVIGYLAGFNGPTFPIANPTMAAGLIWDQLVLLLNGLFPPAQSLYLWSATGSTFAVVDMFSYEFPGLLFEVEPGIAARASDPLASERTLSFGEAGPQILELLKQFGLGLKSIKNTAITNSIIQIHAGYDKTTTVRFSHADGDILSADYLDTVKNHKNRILTTTTWSGITSASLDGRFARWTTADAKDLDQTLTAAPSGGALTLLRNQMDLRGKATLATRRTPVLQRVEINPDNDYTYRKDYNVGDKVTVQTKYTTATAMQVVEYVEIWDETGYRGYPTLAVL